MAVPADGICTKCSKPAKEFVRGNNLRCKDCQRLYDRAYYAKHKNRIAVQHKVRYSVTYVPVSVLREQGETPLWETYCTHKRNNIAKMSKKRAKERRLSDPQYAIACRMRARLNEALKASKVTKTCRMRDLIGLSWADLKIYLAGTFQPGMTWDNRSEWHIDHIRPLSSFDLTDPEQLKQACHYTNLQVLWAADNLRKSAKWEASA